MIVGGGSEMPKCVACSRAVRAAIDTMSDTAAMLSDGTDPRTTLSCTRDVMSDAAWMDVSTSRCTSVAYRT